MKKRLSSIDVRSIVDILRDSFAVGQRRLREIADYCTAPYVPREILESTFPVEEPDSDDEFDYDAIDPDDGYLWCVPPDEVCQCRDCGEWHAFRDLVHGHNDTCRQLCRYSGERL